MVVHRFLVDADERPFLFDERRIFACTAHRYVGGGNDRVLLELRQQIGVEPRQTVATERRQNDRLVRWDLQRFADLLAGSRRVPRDEWDVAHVGKALETTRHR